MEGTYEYELERAELLGVEPISKELWEQQAKARKEQEIEQEETEVAQELQAEDEKIKGTHGKMDELNSILLSTQVKLNKFKVWKSRRCSNTFSKQMHILDCLRELHEFAEDSYGKSSSRRRPKQLKRSSANM